MISKAVAMITIIKRYPAMATSETERNAMLRGSFSFDSVLPTEPNAKIGARNAIAAPRIVVSSGGICCVRYVNVNRLRSQVHIAASEAIGNLIPHRVSGAEIE